MATTVTEDITDAITPDEKTPAAVKVAKATATNNLSAKQEEADSLINRYALMGTASALIPIAGVDILASTAVQTKMIKDLAKIYGFSVDEQLVQTAITTGITAIGGKIVTVVMSTLAASFSPLRMLIGGATQAAVSGFLTLEIGRIYASKMELGVDPNDIGVMDIVDHIVSQVQEGKWDPKKLSLTSQLSGLLTANKS